MWLASAQRTGRPVALNMGRPVLSSATLIRSLATAWWSRGRLACQHPPIRTGAHPANQLVTGCDRFGRAVVPRASAPELGWSDWLWRRLIKSPLNRRAVKDWFEFQPPRLYVISIAIWDSFQVTFVVQLNARFRLMLISILFLFYCL